MLLKNKTLLFLLLTVLLTLNQATSIQGLRVSDGNNGGTGCAVS